MQNSKLKLSIYCFIVIIININGIKNDNLYEE